MPLSTVTAVMFAATLTQVTRALPISQNHRFAIYTPYWHQGPQNYALSDFYGSHKRLGCGSEPCDERLTLLHSQPAQDDGNNAPLINNSKRNKNSYKTGWTMGGMPFSVLYMNPKPHISVRSPISESLRSLPPNYENIEVPPPPVTENRIEEDAPVIQAEALQARFGPDHPSPTMLPTRKQYSIIPQLFVSYGWGPLGK